MATLRNGWKGWKGREGWEVSLVPNLLGFQRLFLSWKERKERKNGRKAGKGRKGWEVSLVPNLLGFQRLFLSWKERKERKEWMEGEEEEMKKVKRRDTRIERIDPKLEYRRNKNRGYRKLRAWRQAIELYVLICEKVKEIPGSPYRLIDQIMDAASSISSNIAEGYCRRSLKEYLYFLNIALGSSGEVYSRCYACFRAGQFSEKTFDEIDAKHYEAEGDLLRLIESLQRKQQEGEWQDNFILREAEVEYFVAESKE